MILVQVEQNRAVLNSEKKAKNALKKIGLPAIIRPSFTLGGTGGGIAFTQKQ